MKKIVKKIPLRVKEKGIGSKLSFPEKMGRI